MKNLSLLISLSMIAASVNAQKSEDQKAIKDMCGCYEVEFKFAETFSYPKDSASYKPSATKQEGALEWVQLVEDQPGKISLQHLLIVGNNHIVKHWRQDWEFENTRFLDYNGSGLTYKELPAEKVKGQWTQRVFEVDDRPRYQGSSSWVHVDGRHFWENTTNAPLPRREYSKRSDYNITKRTSVHEIVKTGWVHDQDNDKIIRGEHGKEYLLAQEKGRNTYTKVEDSRCKAAQDYWKEHKDMWAKVRNRWDAEFAKSRDLEVKSEVDGKHLFMHLFALKNTATQEEVNQIIDQFIVAK